MPYSELFVSRMPAPGSQMKQWQTVIGITSVMDRTSESGEVRPFHSSKALLYSEPMSVEEADALCERLQVELGKLGGVK